MKKIVNFSELKNGDIFKYYREKDEMVIWSDSWSLKKNTWLTNYKNPTNINGVVKEDYNAFWFNAPPGYSGLPTYINDECLVEIEVEDAKPN